MMNTSKKIAITLVATSLLMGTGLTATLPVSAANPVTKSTSSTKQTKPSKAIISAAEKALKDLTGNTYSIGDTNLVEINGEKIWDLRVKGIEISQIFMKGTEVRDIKIDQKWDELKKSYKEQIKAVMQDTLSEQKTPESISVSTTYDKRQDHVGETELYVRSGDHILFIHDGKLTKHIQILTNINIAPAILETAQGVFKGWDGVKQGPLNQGSSWLTREDGKEVYKLVFGNGNTPVFVNIDKPTGKILKAEATELQDSAATYTQSFDKLMNISEAQLLKQAIKQAPALLNLDLTGYTAKKDAHFTALVHFTKKGSVSVNGSYNADGQLYMMERAE